jgi:hypothetical protein
MPHFPFTGPVLTTYLKSGHHQSAFRINPLKSINNEGSDFVCFPSFSIVDISAYDFQMSHISESLPPPDLFYPPEENDPDQPVLATEATYLRTRLPYDTAEKPDESDEGLAEFFNVMQRLIPENDGVHTCSMCGYV